MKKKLELYIHIPFCIKKCSYCDFLSFPADERTQWKYIAALNWEIRFYGPGMAGYRVSSIYIGGGTPSCLDAQWIARLMDVVRRNFDVAEDAEISIECNPGTVTKSKLEVYRRSGVNRLSIGLQSANDQELKLLGRIHTYEQFLQTYELARTVGFSNINVDLISGIPYQTTERFLDSLYKVIRWKPEHISSYSLIVEKGTEFHKLYHSDVLKQQAGEPTGILPDEEEICRMVKQTQQVLREAGYCQYEISNYARPGFECRHNIGYWERTEYLGVGLGAASLIQNIRYTNTRNLEEYLENTEHIESKMFLDMMDSRKRTMGTNLHIQADTLSMKAQMEEYMFLGLRKTAGISRKEFEETFKTPVEAVYGDIILRFQKERLLAMREGRIYLTDRGMDVANYVMSEFLITV